MTDWDKEKNATSPSASTLTEKSKLRELHGNAPEVVNKATEDAAASRLVLSESRSPSQHVKSTEHETKNVSRECWESPGSFAAKSDDHGRTVRIEGWLSHRPGQRDSNDRQVQRDFRKEYGLNDSQCAFHILGHEQGGPTSALHTPAEVKANLVAADKLINVSHHRFVENQLSSDLKAGAAIYCRADIQYKNSDSRACLAEKITYTYFIANAQNEPKPYVVREYVVRTGETPGVRVQTTCKGTTAAQSLRESHVEEFYEHAYKKDPAESI